MKSKRMTKAASAFEKQKQYSFVEALEILKASPPVKFDQSVELAIKLGADPRKSDQQVRGTVALPKGTGKAVRILVFAKGEKLDEAMAAGAEIAGTYEVVQKVKNGWVDFDAVVATPDMMREVGKLGKVLGPRGLMPTPKGGTVTADVAKAVQEIKAGKIEYKLDRHAVINTMVGKLSFESNDLQENIDALLLAIQRSKPATAKGKYFQSIAISSTMGPGVSIDLLGTNLQLT